MIHLRIVAPEDVAHQALELLCAAPSVAERRPPARRRARSPDGDVILCDVAREDASVILGDLKELDIPRVRLDRRRARRHLDLGRRRSPPRRPRPGCPPTRSCGRRSSSAPARTPSCRSASSLFMVAGHADRGGRHPPRPADPDRGRDGRRPRVRPARRALRRAREPRRASWRGARFSALAVGFPVGIARDAPDDVDHDRAGRSARTTSRQASHPSHRIHLESGLLLASSWPSWRASAGMLSLTSAKSGALIGVLISVTTIPAAANIGVAAAYGDWSEAARRRPRSSGINLVGDRPGGRPDAVRAAALLRERGGAST